MDYSKLVPNIEKRLDTWVKVHSKLGKDLAQGKKTTITLSRQYGCEAYPLAEALEKRLEDITGEKWHIFDQAVIKEISKNESLSESFLSNVGNSSQLFDVVTANFFNSISHDDAFKKVVEYILKVAKFGNAIIIGRGAGIITQDLENCFHFRIEASESYRIDSIARRMNVSIDDAQKIVNENQVKREEFLNKYFGHKVSDHNLYDAVFNNARMNVDKMADTIITAISNK